MAENVVNFLLSKLNELISSELKLIQGVDSKINSLSTKLDLMQASLKDIDAKRRDNERVKVWVDQVRDVTFRAEDTVDRYIYEVQYQKYSGFLGLLKNFVSCIYHLKVRHELGCEIEEISQMLQQILANKSEFGIEFNQSVGQASSSLTDSLERSEKHMPIIAEVNVVGFDNVKADIKNELLKGDGQRCVVSVVGMGGVGKTTLATNIYNSNDVKKNFDCQIWISASQMYRKRELLQTIVKELLKLDWKEIAEMGIHDMVDKLRDALRTKKYLLVVDDIWEVAAWKDICSVLPNENNGNRIMVTTRKKEVALGIDPDGFVHELQCLDDEESWNLFCSKVFRNKGDCPLELEKTRAEIVAKCGGLPLAIVILGGLLSRKPKSQVEWRKVLKRIKYEFHERRTDDYESVRKILQLSYDNLPYYLISCFLYLGLFPEDSEIDAQKLIQLWVAEGFVQQRGEEIMEEVAEEYLEELANRSMIQVVKRSSWGRVQSFRVHDLLLDLAVSQGKEDRFLSILAAEVSSANYIYAHSSSTMPRRVAIHRTSVSELFTPTHLHSSSQSLLRSLLNFDAEATLSQVHLLVNNLKLLRVLDLSKTNIKKLPKQIGSMVHLRFLGLGYTNIRKLPSSIGNLHNLQTLLLPGYCRVPHVIWKIKTLRHIFGDEMRSLSVHSDCKGALQTLWGITATSLGGTVLGEFTNLRSLLIYGISTSQVEGLLRNSLPKLTRLNILWLGLDCGPGNALTMILSALANHSVLNYLCLWFSSIADGKRGEAREPLSSDDVNPQFPPSLTEIALHGTQFSKPEQLASLQSLPNLKILELSDNAYIDKEMVFSADGFPKLQKLSIHTLLKLELWTIEKGAMPSLQHLDILSCYRLEMVPEGLQHITTLQDLTLSHMSEKFRQRVQNEEGEDWDKVQHIPSITL